MRRFTTHFACRVVSLSVCAIGLCADFWLIYRCAICHQIF